MLNIEKYKEEFIDEWAESGEDSFLDDIKNVARKHGLNFKYCEDVMDWLCSESKDLPLENDEKKFLKDLKREINCDAIRINYPYLDLLIEADYSKELDLHKYLCALSIPCLEHYNFINLEREKVYTLEELGI